MLQSEKKSFFRFISIYIFLVVILIVTFSVFYYNTHIERIKIEHKAIMQEFSTLQLRRLKWLHNHFPKYHTYPRDSRYNSAIYDNEYKEIFSTLICKDVNFQKNFYYCGNSAIYIRRLSDYYLGAKYLIIEIPKNSTMLKSAISKIIIFALISLIFLIYIGYILAKMFVKPMRESINILDNFIKDTTHEINTPISIINTNIEMLESAKNEEKRVKYIKRIKIASRTLENIYKDLRYLTLCNVSNYKDELIYMKKLIEERVEYFALHMEAKNIKSKLYLEDVTINADRKLIVRLVDNIISNAIKYNKLNGSINIILKNKELIIEDSGIGIKKDNLKEIFQRYRRFNSVEGGFGIGLNIVQNIAKIYNFKIDIYSKENIGTKVTIKWED